MRGRRVSQTFDPHEPERRQNYRRADDVEQREIVDHAIAEAPLVHQLLKTTKIAVAVGSLFTFIGGLAGAAGYKIIGPTAQMKASEHRIDTIVAANRARISSMETRQDSLLNSIIRMSVKLDQMAYIQCVQLRRSDPDLRPDGCDAPLKK